MWLNWTVTIINAMFQLLNRYIYIYRERERERERDYIYATWKII